MIVEYNSVPLWDAEIQAIKREAVWDDSHTTLLYIRWVIGVVGYYAPNGYPHPTSVTALRTNTNTGTDAELSAGPPRVSSTVVGGAVGGITSAATSTYAFFKKLIKGKNAVPSPVVLREVFAADPSAAARFPSGYGPILTDVTLRNRLMTPRQSLRILGVDAKSNAWVTLLQSPKLPYVCDPTCGPHPICLDILSGQDQSFAVFFQIETTVLPCEDDSDRLILAHNWVMTHGHDDNQYLTQVIEGELILNGAMVHTLATFADAFRSQFFHPIPLGCYRKIPYIRPSEDGCSYVYRIEDVDQTITFDPGDSGATTISIAEKLSYIQPWKFADKWVK